MRCCRGDCAGLFVVFVALFSLSVMLPGYRRAHAQEAPTVRPGKEHALLAKFVGTWECTTHFRLAPDQPAVTTTGIETHRLGCGGFWLISDYKGEFLGQQFEGHGTLGYDQKKGKYVGAWIDSMTSSLSLSEGTYDEKTRTFTFENTTTDPQTGEKLVYKSKQVIKDDDHHVMSMYIPGTDGKAFESLRIEYSRKKGGAPAPKADPLARIVGNWKLLVKYEEDGEALDYGLRITKAGSGLKGVLISPRSGEYPFKSVAWKDGVLRLAIVRDFGGGEIELKYEARLSDKGLSGKVSVGEFAEGSWTATKK